MFKAQTDALKNVLQIWLLFLDTINFIHKCGHKVLITMNFMYNVRIYAFVSMQVWRKEHTVRIDTNKLIYNKVQIMDSIIIDGTGSR